MLVPLARPTMKALMLHKSILPLLASTPSPAVVHHSCRLEAGEVVRWVPDVEQGLNVVVADEAVVVAQEGWLEIITRRYMGSSEGRHAAG